MTRFHLKDRFLGIDFCNSINKGWQSRSVDFYGGIIEGVKMDMVNIILRGYE